MSLKKNIILIFGFTLLFSIIHACSEPSKKNTLYIFGQDYSSDIIEVIDKHFKIKLYPYSSLEKTLAKIDSHEGVLILAENYPAEQVVIEDKAYQIIRDKNLRVFIEYPSKIPEVEIDETAHHKDYRAVVSSNNFKPLLDSLSILSINGLNHIPIKTKIEAPYIVAAKIAGFDEAIFGLPDETDPLLFELSSTNILISTTRFSNFIKGRYAPQRAWESIWKEILTYVSPHAEIDELNWDPEVTVTYGKEEKLPVNYQIKSIQRGIDWYKNAKMLIGASFADSIQSLVDSGTERVPWHDEIPLGDGTHGSMECVFSEINENGSQPLGLIVRGDCVSETAMAFATSGTVLKDEESYKIAQNLLDFYLFDSSATKNQYGNPNHGAYGLIPWGISNYNWYKASYGDDNARFILATLVTSALLKTDRWDETIMKSLFALLRTTGQNGFRGSRIDLHQFEENGWKHFYEREILNLSPHFEAYLWACYIWAYNQTGDELFLDKAEQGISIMMENYPNELVWTNGLAQEKARMLLPLSWLVRIRDTTENRDMLHAVVNDVLALQDESGAIREELGSIEMGMFPPPQSNEAYGTNEASLIAKNGDPVSDLLYTTNFAFLGLHEASYTLNNPNVKKAVDKLAEFLCRIQAKSEGHPELNGGWMRAFDFERFEHWGSNADSGWGAWVIESGWTQGWITSVLSLRELDVSIWDLTENSSINDYYPDLKLKLLDNE